MIFFPFCATANTVATPPGFIFSPGSLLSSTKTVDPTANVPFAAGEAFDFLEEAGAGEGALFFVGAGEGDLFLAGAGEGDLFLEAALGSGDFEGTLLLFFALVVVA